MEGLILTAIGLLISFGMFLTPIVLAAVARDRQHASNLAETERRFNTAMQASERRLAEKIDREIGLVNDRLTRVKDDYARRPEVEALEKRIETAIKEMKEEGRRTLDKLDVRLREMTESFDSGLREVKQLISSLQHNNARSQDHPGGE